MLVRLGIIPVLSQKRSVAHGATARIYVSLMSNPIKAASIVFDLDGTLADTAPDLVRALNAVIAPEGMVPVPLEDVRHMVGRGARALLERAFSRQGKTVSDEKLDSLTSAFIDAYQADICIETRLFNGVRDTLEILAQRGARLSVATNKPHALAVALIETLDLTSQFERIVGADMAPRKKPDPAHIFAAAGPNPGKIVMIGDSETDLQAGRNAGAPVILARFGYSDVPIETLNADRLVNNFSEIPEAVASLLA